MADKSRPIPLSRLVQRFASFSFNEIEKLLDENSGDESQKRALMRTLNSIYILGTKLHMAIQFDNNYRNSKEVYMYLHNSSFYFDYLKLFADDLFQHQQYLAANMVSMYDIRAAIDLLIDNCHSRLPRSVFPKVQQSFTQDPKKFYSLIRDILKSKLLTTRVPTHFKVSFNRGRVILKCPNKYKLYLTITSKNGPFVASKIQYLLPDFSAVSHPVFREYMRFRSYQTQQYNDILNAYSVNKFLVNGYDVFNNFFIRPDSIDRIISKVNELLQKYEDSLYEVDELIQKTIQLFDHQRLYIEAIRLQSAPPTGIQKIKFLSPFAFQVVFWDENSFFDIAITKNGSKIFLQGKTDIGDSYGLKITQILGLCQRRIALMKLHSLQNVIQGTINEEPKVPVLHFALFNIIVESLNGMFHVVENPDLDKYLVTPDKYLEFAKLANRIHSQEIYLHHVKGDSSNL